MVVDGRFAASATTCSGITDWEAGEELSTGGLQAGASKSIWMARAGAPGWAGVTMHGDRDGSGVIGRSLTGTGLRASGATGTLRFSRSTAP